MDAAVTPGRLAARLRLGMETYRIRFELRGPSATAWQADTLWGHLCWALVRRQGAAALGEFLAAYARGAPPLVLSDGYPEGWLPRPMLPPPAVAGLSKRQAIEAARRGKAAGGTLMSVAQFERLRRGEPAAEDEATPVGLTRRGLDFHNAIDRRTDTARGDAGGLYALPVEHTPVVEVYARLEPAFAPALRELLADVAVEGYGKRRSVGYGAIAGWTLEPFDGFGEVAGADGFVSLSRFVPAAADPADGMWRTVVKTGTVGGETGAPFKRPLVLLTAGSWFRTEGAPREWYGRIVSGMSERHPEVVQYGLAFALPLRAPSEAVAEP